MDDAAALWPATLEELKKNSRVQADYGAEGGGLRLRATAATQRR